MHKISGQPQRAVALIKFFSQQDHCSTFKSGKTRFGTPHSYRLNDNPGRGDRSESCLRYWDRGLGDIFPSLGIDGSPFNLSSAESLLVYPEHEQKDAWLQSWCIMGPDNQFEESLQRMVNEFGRYFVVMPAKNIESYARLIHEKTGLNVKFGAMKYSDNPLDWSLTVKDSSLSYQKEFRFYLGECHKDEVKIKEPQVPGINDLLTDAGSLRFVSPSGVTRYYSQGQQQVVKVQGCEIQS